MTAQSRFETAIRRFDELNSDDPNVEILDGVPHPKEIVYAERMTRWVEKLDSSASETLRLAARSQHLCRWKIPRADFPMDRAGYHRWRTTLYGFHADTAAEALRAAGYDEESIDRVRGLLQKRRLKTNADMQTLEDAAALVFLENHLAEFAERDDIDEAKLLDILRKTWKKMSTRGHEAALGLELPENAGEAMRKALG